MSIEIVWIISSIYTLLSLLVTLLILKRDDLEPVQKIAQSIMVWLIPFVAAIGIWLFFRSEDRNSAQIKSFAKKNQQSSGSSSYYSSAGSGGSD